MDTADIDSTAGYSSGGFLNLLDHDVAGWQQRVAFLRTLPGLTHVELWVEELELAGAELSALRESLAGLRVAVHAPYLQVSLVSHHEEVRRAAREVHRRTLALAAELSAQVVTFIGGGRPFFVTEEAARGQLSESLHELGVEARRQGCLAQLAVKNMPVAAGEGHAVSTYPAALAEVRALIDARPELRVSLDVGYCVQSRESWMPFLRSEVDRVANVHLHDALEGGASHLCLGTGSVDAFALARLLRVSGYEGFVSLLATGQRDTQRSWDLWRRAQREAAQETTATLGGTRRSG